jgi:hypothetical protein
MDKHKTYEESTLFGFQENIVRVEITDLHVVSTDSVNLLFQRNYLA